jgi:HSP20 family protein
MTMTPTDIETKPKHKVERRDESTRPGQYFQPTVDIFETPDELVVQADVPGVPPNAVDVQLEGDQLTIEARVRPDEYEGLKPLHVEYGVGAFYRRFMLGEAIDRESIKAQVKNGVLTLHLPKAQRARMRRIEVSAS